VKRANAIARARRVYLEAAPTAPPEVITPAIPSRSAHRYDVVESTTPTTTTKTGRGVSELVLETLNRYERSDPAARPSSYDSVQAFTSSFESLRSAAPVWIRAGSSPQRRRLAIATYALDLINANPAAVADGPTMRSADPALRSMAGDHVAALTSPSASDVVEWACNLLREDSSLPVERTWHLASIAALERFRGQSSLDSHIAHAENRFPKDPAWALARAVSAELRTWPEHRDDVDYRPPSGLTASRVEARFREAAESAETRREARLRWGYFELRRGRADDALLHFAEVGEPDDAVLRYWLHLFRGRALERVGRLDDAIASYRAAFSDVPYAQSATTALAVALVANQRADEAAALTNRMLSVQPPLDPWHFYTFPGARFWQMFMSEMHEAMKP
jgi:tetratricopeptide (TPR) repeat protein